MLNVYKVKLKSQIIANKICTKCNLPFLKIVVDVTNNDECYGEYYYTTNIVKLYAKVCNEFMTIDDMIEVLYHELAHHYQHYYFNNLEHNKIFKETILYLKHIYCNK